jgi:hypothetical protein
MANDKSSGKADQHAARKARLAAALRENLKRRKQQARQRSLTRDRDESRPGKPSERGDS